MYCCPTTEFEKRGFNRLYPGCSFPGSSLSDSWVWILQVILNSYFWAFLLCTGKNPKDRVLIEMLCSLQIFFSKPRELFQKLFSKGHIIEMGWVKLSVGVADRVKTSTLHVSGEKRSVPVKRENINWVRLRVIGNALRHLFPISGSHFYPYSKRQMHSSCLWKLMGIGTQKYS